MKDDLNFLGKWKTTSIFRRLEDDLNLLGNCNNLIILGKWKTTSILF